MSHLSSGAVAAFGALTLMLALVAAGACGSPKPPLSTPPEASTTAPAEPVDASAAATPAAEAPAPTSGATTTPLEEVGKENAAPAVQSLFVREQLADCHGEAPMKCLQVREVATEEWRNLYAPIEGFEYEPGHAYELRVEVTQVAKPPADGSSLRYRLLEVVSKQKRPSAAK